MSAIALIDYRAGNLTSVKKALAAVGADVYVPDAPDALTRAKGIIVPGVGHFGATLALGSDWMRAIRNAIASERWLLGICLGMQWLFEGSDEAPEAPGLGLLAGRCWRLSGGAERLKVPHVGWNALERRREAPIASGIPDHAQVYFTHSYVAPISDDTVTATHHGEPFASMVERERVAGVQFHPEKSGDVGLAILGNWVRRVG